MPLASRNRRSWLPSTILRAVGPLPAGSPVGMATSVVGLAARIATTHSKPCGRVRCATLAIATRLPQDVTLRIRQSAENEQQVGQSIQVLGREDVGPLGVRGQQG